MNSSVRTTKYGGDQSRWMVWMVGLFCLLLCAMWWLTDDSQKPKPLPAAYAERRASEAAAAHRDKVEEVKQRLQQRVDSVRHQQQLVKPADHGAASSSEMLHGALGLDEEGRSVWMLEYARPPPEDPNNRNHLHPNGFNAALSRSMPLDRPLPDPRAPACLRRTNNASAMPDTSVVFVFHNEELSTLLRSVHSVLNRSPPSLLKEIVLIDDGSDRPDLFEPLERYIAALPPKIKLHRLHKRTGLVHARIAGVELATAQTFTILDSHI